MSTPEEDTEAEATTILTLDIIPTITTRVTTTGVAITAIPITTVAAIIRTAVPREADLLIPEVAVSMEDPLGAIRDTVVAADLRAVIAEEDIPAEVETTDDQPRPSPSYLPHHNPKAEKQRAR